MVGIGNNKIKNKITIGITSNRNYIDTLYFYFFIYYKFY